MDGAAEPDLLHHAANLGRSDRLFAERGLAQRSPSARQQQAQSRSARAFVAGVAVVMLDGDGVPLDRRDPAPQPDEVSDVDLDGVGRRWQRVPAGRLAPRDEDAPVRLVGKHRPGRQLGVLKPPPLGLHQVEGGGFEGGVSVSGRGHYPENRQFSDNPVCAESRDYATM